MSTWKLVLWLSSVTRARSTWESAEWRMAASVATLSSATLWMSEHTPKMLPMVKSATPVIKTIALPLRNARVKRTAASQSQWRVLSQRPWRAVLPRICVVKVQICYKALEQNWTAVRATYVTVPPAPVLVFCSWWHRWSLCTWSLNWQRKTNVGPLLIFLYFNLHLACSECESKKFIRQSVAVSFGKVMILKSNMFWCFYSKKMMAFCDCTCFQYFLLFKNKNRRGSNWTLVQEWTEFSLLLLLEYVLAARQIFFCCGSGSVWRTTLESLTSYCILKSICWNTLDWVEHKAH